MALRRSTLLVLSLLLAGPVAADVFVDRAAGAGIDFVHFNGMSGEFYFPEMTGAGGALFDYDGDGDLDVYLVQGAMMGPGKEVEQATFPPRHPLPLTDRLYRNDSALGPDGRPVLRFADVTEAAGLEARGGYGMGVAAGDYDGDGLVDLYLTAFGSNTMLHNEGDGTFRDTTAATGTDDTRWSVSAAFLDYDRDGHLDLYVGNYVDFSYTVQRVCATSTGERDYCGPLAYDPEPDRLFRNRGDGTFEDASVASRIQSQRGTALGVATADLDGDGWIDIYVANDEMPNFLWINQRDGSFRDDALLAGAALRGDGQAQASMGVDAGDFDADGDDDLFMTHLTGDYNTLYINEGGTFRDASNEAGLANPSWNYTGFGTVFLDYDNDGSLDLVAANGAVKTIEALARQGDPYPLHQTNQLFRNLGGSAFEEVTASSGEVFALSEVSRGIAAGDVDDDGDTDVLLTNNAGPARLLINEVGHDRPWLGLRALNAAGSIALGARAAIERPGRPPLVRRARADGSYASANDPRIYAGLGEEGRIEALRITWPDGRGTELRGVPGERWLTIAVPRAGGGG